MLSATGRRCAATTGRRCAATTEAVHHVSLKYGPAARSVFINTLSHGSMYH